MHQPYGHQEYPAHGYPQPGYGYPQPMYQPPASGGTAITAGILAIVLALTGILGVLTSIGVGHDQYYREHAGEEVRNLFYVSAAVEGGIVALLLLGGILLMNHKNAGRIILIILASLGLLGGFAGTIAGILSPLPAAAIPGVIGVLVTVLLLALTLAGSTKRWCAQGRHAPYPYY
ncbi:hypothetical protein [Nocardia wallacei]|uniref:DUF4064 domain-containing protein n=1 Tax=Nocardia wallacei TaxID=480035 RepID=A0A7G1KB33_9NOCA|nr:hypothetical protein [Nocardia wallacei]BCK52342.1 hypothetical protein NWFMUON74_01140 [Nocardia wallacei]